MTTTNPTPGSAKRVGPRPDAAAVVDAYADFARRSCRPDGWDAVAVLSGNLEAARTLLVEAHGDCTTPDCRTCIPLRHAGAYLLAFHLWVAR